MRNLLFLSLLLSLPFGMQAQSFTSYFTGDTADVSVPTTAGIVLMGGAGESDSAMVWFLERAIGGDILVLRASGSDGYNTYLYSQLGVSVNSVETILFNNASAASDPYVLQQIANADAIWIAGGDQYNYVQYWKDNTIEDLLNDHLNLHNRPIGGISAGMAILGGDYFDAANGTVTSNTALNNPFDSKVSLGSGDFLNYSHLQNVITDTHYDDPDRKGRHITFLARLSQQRNARSFGIACDEYTAVCIDENGIASIFGDFPTFNDNAYFLQGNCISPILPETLSTGQPLTWDRNNEAVKVYAVKGTPTGTNTFDLNDWKSGSGGSWENWYVVNGQFLSGPSSAPNCSLTALEDHQKNPSLYPNPGNGKFYIQKGTGDLSIYDLQGKVVWENSVDKTTQIDISSLEVGIYLVDFVDLFGASERFKYVKTE